MTTAIHKRINLRIDAQSLADVYCVTIGGTRLTGSRKWCEARALKARVPIREVRRLVDVA